MRLATYLLEVSGETKGGNKKKRKVEKQRCELKRKSLHLPVRGRSLDAWKNSAIIRFCEVVCNVGCKGP